ncbi:MAG: glycine--tRNA ligase subunit beta, partial [Atopobiaceae bacterium]|nr:glycine--tRNA ligase subunit beta [Atopobiaceae bacterium]
LDDAKFYYDEDLKVPMEEMLDRLGTITFQVKLGTVRQKVERMERIAEATANACGFEASDAALAVRAAHLAKADLVSQAVIEFTSQRGVMGGYYAEAAGEDPRVAAAVRDHYRPRFAGDALPEDAIGKVVAIADKLDTICGMFAINEPPTGSSDPYAVRRAAIGVIALLRELPSADFPGLIECALSAYADQGIDFDADAVASDVESFFLGRLVQIAKGEGAAQDAIDAVSAVGVISPKEFLKRVSALEAARRESPELFADLSISYGRAANLGDASLGEDVDVELLGSAERELLAACMVGEDRVSKALADDDYESALACLAELRAPIDRFFEEVLVMDEDEAVRENRLRLLNKFVSVFRGLADMGVLSRNS